MKYGHRQSDVAVGQQEFVEKLGFLVLALL